MEDGRVTPASLAEHTWYHTIELPGGVVTPGYYDLRSAAKRFPWPDLGGKRCLDVGTFDGFLAFEMERRGASEVVAIDVDDYESLDWPARIRPFAAKELAEAIGEERGRGFRIAKEALGSKVKRVPLNVYDLSPDVVGTFDVVVCGSILTHLRDPIHALEAMRHVCDGKILVTEGIDLWLTLRHPRRPLMDFRGIQDQWYAVNARALRHMLIVAGFAIEKETGRYPLAYGPGFRQSVGVRGVLGRIRRAGPRASTRVLARLALHKLLTGSSGPPHVAILARPEI